MAWTKNKVTREGYLEESLLLTKEAIKGRTDINKVIKLQNMAIATRAQCHLNQQFYAKTVKLTHIQLKMYKSPTCTFCNMNVPETNIYLIGECLLWEDHMEISNVMAEAGINITKNLLLRHHHNYTHIHANRNKKNWKHKKRLYTSIARIPHEDFLDQMKHIPKKLAIEVLAKITNTILNRQLDRVKSRNKQFYE